MIKISSVLAEADYQELSDRLEEMGLSAKVIKEYEPALLGFMECGDDETAKAVYDGNVALSVIARRAQEHALSEGEPISDDDAYIMASDELGYNGSYWNGLDDPVFLHIATPHSMNMRDYQANAMRTARGMEDPSSLANWGLGLAGEAGEVVELIKKSLYHGKVLDKSELAKELGDVMWYVAAIATQTGLDLDAIAETNVSKLAMRYPNGFVEGGGDR